MGRRTNQCSENHTPVSPHKNRIRRDMLRKVSPTKDVITISHGALDTLMTMGWQGRVQTCDIDPGVVQAIEFLRAGHNGHSGDYPDLNLLPPGRSIQATVQGYCSRHGVKDLGIVDVDLADTILPCWTILCSVLNVLVKNKYRGKTFLTFRNGRDAFNSIQERAEWLEARLPKGVIVGSVESYNSMRLDPNAKRSKGSAMCIVELQHT